MFIKNWDNIIGSAPATGLGHLICASPSGLVELGDFNPLAGIDCSTMRVFSTEKRFGNFHATKKRRLSLLRQETKACRAAKSNQLGGEAVYVPRCRDFYLFY